MEENEWIRIKFVQSPIRHDIKVLRYQLIEIAEKEATKLCRLKRNMLRHKCSLKSLYKIQEEIWDLRTNMVSYPERLWDSSIQWKYAFKF